MLKKNYILIAMAVLGVVIAFVLLTRNSEELGDDKSRVEMDNESTQVDDENMDEIDEVDLEDTELKFEDDAMDLDTGLDGAEDFDTDDLNADVLDEDAF